MGAAWGLVALALVACQSARELPTFPQIEGQPQAAAFAWQGEGGPPPVEWVDGAPCVPGSPWPAIKVGAVCAAGTYDGVIVRVVRVPPHLGRPFSDSGLAHELMHAALDEATGDQDVAHVAPEWARIPEINARMREEGL